MVNWRAGREDSITYGSLCTVTVSGYEQGVAAGKIARSILVESRRPSSFAMEATVKGKPVISLARANQLRIKVDSQILLTTQLVEKFEWEHE